MSEEKVEFKEIEILRLSIKYEWIEHAQHPVLGQVYDFFLNGERVARISSGESTKEPIIQYWSKGEVIGSLSLCGQFEKIREKLSQREGKEPPESYERKIAEKADEELLDDMEKVRRKEDRTTPKPTLDRVPSSIREKEARGMAKGMFGEKEKEEGREK